MRAVHRFEVRPAPGLPDTRGAATRRAARDIGINPTAIHCASIYLIEAQLTDADINRIAAGLLADPVTETVTIGATTTPDANTIEILPQPGVMDPAAQTVQVAVEELTNATNIFVVTGRRYDFEGITPDQADTIARRLLANPVVHDIHKEPFHPVSFPHGHAKDQRIETIPILGKSADELLAISRQGAFALNVEEMRTIQIHYQTLDREPTLIELESLAQTWSEHCVHKTFKSTINYRCEGDVKDVKNDTIDWSNRPGVTINPDGSVTIDNLLKSTVAAATFELIDEGLDWTLSVFDDNAGVIRFDEDNAICVKVETHNHPSAIEPYGGAATGVGGCVRDIMGTGLAAKPIANTDVFCVAYPDLEDIPTGCLHPKRILQQVVAGVRDYGNRMGIPTVNGAVHFDNRYIGNPLVYVGCIGILPTDKVFGDPQPGDRIVALGGRTGRDGIHGATFSSEELTDTHADEFAHAVQIGNAIEEKKTLDAILRARDEHDKPLYTAITDCGAGGFSSAVGEMGEKLGANVNLAKAPLKYAGLTATEIWISEAQERMVLSVPSENIEALQRICDEEHVELANLGTFGTPNAQLILNFDNLEVGRLPMDFLHNGLPKPTRNAIWTPPSQTSEPGRPRPGSSKHPQPNIDLEQTLLKLLSDPNIASKRWIIRQYDHEVQGATIIKPLVGPGGIGPGDAAVIQPVPDSKQGLAIACGMATAVGDPAHGGDPYQMALHAIDECVRNLVCVGADPDRIAILDNFCWPGCNKPENLAALVRAAVGCYDAAKAYKTPFISGKDSLNNQFTTDTGETIEIPPTLLISGVGIVPDVGRCVTMDVKINQRKKSRPDSMSMVCCVGSQSPSFYASAFERITGVNYGDRPSVIDLDLAVRTARAVSELVSQGLVRAVHDCSEGGAAISLIEMAIAACGEAPTYGCCFSQLLELDASDANARIEGIRQMFGEGAGRYLIQFRSEDEYCEPCDRAVEIMSEHAVPWAYFGYVFHADRVVACWSPKTVPADLVGRIQFNSPMDPFIKAFHAPLDW